MPQPKCPDACLEARRCWAGGRDEIADASEGQSMLYMSSMGLCKRCDQYSIMSGWVR